LEQLKALLDKAHTLGIKLPYLRDPLKGTPSVSLTLMMISFVLYILTLVNKLAGWFGDVDGTFQLLVLTTSLYFGRSFGNSGKGKTSTDEK
jgi:hypothetical protein